MNRLRPWLVVGTALLMVGGLNLLILSEYRARAEGTPIRLAIEGIDPRSPLSGHYVQLRFTEPLPKGVGCSSMLRRQRDARWIALRTQGERTVVVAETDTREAALRRAPIAVRGSLGCWGVSPDAEAVSLNIGLDRFHASQKEALAIEAALRTTTAEAANAFALVSVGRDGKARLLGLEVEGRRIMLNWFTTTD